MGVCSSSDTWGISTRLKGIIAVRRSVVRQTKLNELARSDGGKGRGCTENNRSTCTSPIILLSCATCTYSNQFLNVRHNNCINKLSESQLNVDYSRKRIGSCQSNALMREVRITITVNSQLVRLLHSN